MRHVCQDGGEINRQLPGVAEAQVNLGNETATVEFEASLLNLADIEKAISGWNAPCACEPSP